MGAHQSPSNVGGSSEMGSSGFSSGAGNLCIFKDEGKERKMRKIGYLVELLREKRVIRAIIARI